MPLRDLLKSKDKTNEDAESEPYGPRSPQASEFKFMRTDTHTQEYIEPPDFDDPVRDSSANEGASETKGHRFSLLRGGRSRSNSNASSTSQNTEKSKERSPNPKRLSQRLGLKRETSSTSVPQNLPEITDDQSVPGAAEGQWEQRATMLARENEKNRSRPITPVGKNMPDVESMKIGTKKASSVISTGEADDNIQEAIRLHESGDLVNATRMFGRLADPNGENNALSQVLYGLALRHGWGCTADPVAAMKYLSEAASNAAFIEDAALKSGRKQGGAAKGELVLAIFELANSFRHGWGVKKDAVAAKQYYETAANLGDTDAMNEVGWCYLEGYGCKKDKLAAAKYYRLAENGGNKILGNSWIWKEKYDPSK